MDQEIKNNAQVVLAVEGMTCSACSAAVERVTSRLPGVASSSVNLATNRATIVYDPDQVKLTEIKNAIEARGYHALDIQGEETRDEEREKPFSFYQSSFLQYFPIVPKSFFFFRFLFFVV